MKNKKACIVIPLYKHQLSAYEQISLDQCLKVLGAYNIFLVAPEKLRTQLLQNPYVRSGEIGLKTFADGFFTSIPAYNRLLKYPGFYKAFLEYEFMLIYQLDAFVFQDDLERWCNAGYDNIGAPLFEGHDFATKDSVLVGQGNGGFCLRNIHKSYRVLNQFRRLSFKRKFEGPPASFLVNLYRFIKHDLIFNYSRYPFQPIINEDLFWSELVPEAFPEFIVPTPEAAIGFSFEVNPDVLWTLNGNKLPFGCHAWWRYDLAFWKKHIESYGYEL
jgi:hypothetical protein